MKSIQKPIVIVGAGFAGMTFALNLKNLNPSLPILVVDSESNFIFKPLMYEVLSKELRCWEASPKFANIFSDAGITFLKNCLTKISFKENILEFSDELKLSYQYLIICTGSIPNSFFIKGVDENCYFFNDVHDLNKLNSFLKELIILAEFCPALRALRKLSDGFYLVLVLIKPQPYLTQVLQH